MPTPSSELPNDCDHLSVDPNAQKRPPDSAVNVDEIQIKPQFNADFWREI